MERVPFWSWGWGLRQGRESEDSLGLEARLLGSKDVGQATQKEARD